MTDSLARCRSLRFSHRATLLLVAVLLSSSCNRKVPNDSDVTAAGGEADDALAECNEAIRVNPGSAEAYWNRANAYSRRHRNVEAIGDLTEAIRLEPDAAGAYSFRGVVRTELGQYDAAITDFAEAIRILPDFALPYAGRGRLWCLRGDYRQALRDFDDAIRVDPRYSTAYFERADVWLKKGMYDSAIQDLDKAVEYDARYALAYKRLAWIQATCPDGQYRDGTKAVENAAKACELGSWTFSGDVDALAAAHAEAGDFDAAIKFEKQAIAMEPDDAGFIRAAKRRIALYKEHKPYRDQ